MREEELASVLPFWNRLKKAHRALACEDVKRLSLKKGDRVNASEEEHGCFCIRKGSFCALLLGEKDSETELFRVHKDSICLLDYKTVCGRALPELSYECTSVAEIYVMGQDAFSALFEGNTAFEEMVVKNVLSAFPALVSAISQRDYYPLDRRIATYLLEESARQRSNTIYVTHNQIAAGIGSAREAVTRKLNEMSEQGLLATYRGRIVLIAKDRLKKGK